MIAGRSAPRYQTLALMYPQSKTLRDAIFEYFIVVVNVCHHMLQFSQKSTLARVASSVTDSELSSFETDLNTRASIIREEVAILTLRGLEEDTRESSMLRALTSKFSESTAYRKQVKNRIAWLDACTLYDYETPWKQIRKRGNASLHRKNTQYHDWKMSESNGNLVVAGKLGSGKSVLLANIVDDLHLLGNATLVAYIFSRYASVESLKARTIFGSLARQLLSRFTDGSALPPYPHGSPAQPDVSEIIKVLKSALPKGQAVFCVLDGLDDCDSTEVSTLFAQLRELASNIKLRLCISVRSGVDLEFRSQVDALEAQWNLPLSDDNPDIASFIESELESRLDSGRLVLGDPTLVLDIRDALLRGANGMFLWVTLQIECITLERTDNAIRKALQELPKDLSETFCRILLNSKRAAPQHQRKTLEFLIAAYRPLTVEEFREALSVEPGNTNWDPGSHINNIFGVLSSCGSLIIVDEEELTVRFIHESVRQFLLGQMSDTEPHEWQTTTEACHNSIVGAAMTYLSYGVFDTQMSTHVKSELPIPHIPSKVMESVLSYSGPQSSVVKRIALRMLKSPTNSAQDLQNLGHVLVEMANAIKLQRATEYHFLPYARAYWLLHSRFVEENTLNYNLFSAMLAKSSQFQFKWMGQSPIESIPTQMRKRSSHPVESSPSLPPESGFIPVLSTVAWAICHSHVPLLESELRSHQGIRALGNVLWVLVELLKRNCWHSLEKGMLTRLLPIAVLFRMRIATALLKAGADPSPCNDLTIEAAVEANNRELASGLITAQPSWRALWPRLLVSAARQKKPDAQMIAFLARFGLEQADASTRLVFPEPRLDIPSPEYVRILYYLLRVKSDLRNLRAWAIFQLLQYMQNNVNRDFFNPYGYLSASLGGSAGLNKLLFYSIGNDDVEVTRQLIENGADPRPVLATGKTFLQVAIHKASSKLHPYPLVKLLLDSGVVPEFSRDSLSPHTHSPLHDCLITRNWGLAKHLISNGARSSEIPKTTRDELLVHTCVGAEDLEGLDFLLKYDREAIDHRSTSPYKFPHKTPLHVAISSRKGDYVSVRLLADRGVNLNLRSGEANLPPLWIALRRIFEDSDLLHASEWDPLETRDIELSENSVASLHVKRLIDFGADVNSPYPTQDQVRPLEFLTRIFCSIVFLRHKWSLGSMKPSCCILIERHRNNKSKGVLDNHINYLLNCLRFLLERGDTPFGDNHTDTEDRVFSCLDMIMESYHGYVLSENSRKRRDPLCPLLICLYRLAIIFLAQKPEECKYDLGTRPWSSSVRFGDLGGVMRDIFESYGADVGTIAWNSSNLGPPQMATYAALGMESRSRRSVLMIPKSFPAERFDEHGAAVERKDAPAIGSPVDTSKEMGEDLPKGEGNDLALDPDPLTDGEVPL